jgi:HlyD family secretion protein
MSNASGATTEALFGAEDPLAPAEVDGALPGLAPAPAEPLLPTRPRRRWPALVAAVALVLAGVGAWAWREHAGTPTPSFETARLERGRIVVQVTASGTVSALKTVQVGSQVSGRVAELRADFNDTVTKGQLLARLDTQLFTSAVEQARASHAVAVSNVSKAEAQLAEAERQFARGKTLGQAQFLAQEAVDTAGAAADVARAALLGARAQAQQAAASLHQAQLNLAMTAIYSPIDGVVISRSVDVGQTVAASLQAPTVFTLAEDLRKMQVEAHVAEGDVAKLTPGMAVTFTVDAFPGRKFAGILRQVRNAAQTVQSVVTYDAIVDVDNPQLQLRPGMTANVTFVVAEQNDVLRIPNAALRFRPSREALAKLTGARPGAPVAIVGTRPGGPPATDRKMLFVLGGDGKSVMPVRIRTGITDGSFTQLLEGDVSEGASLVTDMNDGSKPRATGAGGANMGPRGATGMPGMGPGAPPPGAIRIGG